MSLYKILSIDPGMNTFGYCISTYDEFNYTILDANTYNLEILYKEFDKCKRYYPIVYTKVAILRKLILKLMNENKPDFITSEAAFYNPSRPAAYASLLRFIHTLEDTIYTVYKKNTYRLAPSIIKKISNAHLGGQADKNDMKEALLKNISNKNIKTKIDISQLDEHAIDASLIGYAFTKLWIPIITAGIVPPKITNYTHTLEKDINKIYKKMLEKNSKCKLKK